MKPTLSQREARRCCGPLLKLSILKLSVSKMVTGQAGFPAGFKVLAVMDYFNWFNFRNLLDFIIVAATGTLAHAQRLKRGPVLL